MHNITYLYFVSHFKIQYHDPQFNKVLSVLRMHGNLWMLTNTQDEYN